MGRSLAGATTLRVGIFGAHGLDLILRWPGACACRSDCRVGSVCGGLWCTAVPVPGQTGPHAHWPTVLTALAELRYRKGAQLELQFQLRISISYTYTI
jgi:hypothetical protein